MPSHAVGSPGASGPATNTGPLHTLGRPTPSSRSCWRARWRRPSKPWRTCEARRAGTGPRWRRQRWAPVVPHLAPSPTIRVP